LGFGNLNQPAAGKGWKFSLTSLGSLVTQGKSGYHHSSSGQLDFSLPVLSVTVDSPAYEFDPPSFKIAKNCQRIV